MTIRVAINHDTEYQFDRPVSVSPHVVRLRPAPHCRTPISSFSLKVEPGDHFVNWQQDPFGNYLARFVFPEKVTGIKINVEVIAEMTVINPFDFFLEEEAEHYPFEYDELLKDDLGPYLDTAEKGPLLTKWLEGVKREKTPIVDFLVALNQRLQNEIEYLIRMEPGVQSCEETLEKQLGSCRDSAWLLVQILRHLGLAARFASGYLVQLTADQKSLDGPSGPESDFTDLHAWAEVFLPGAGWIGLDPTSGLFAGEGHIPLACTPDPASAAPITGATDPCEVDFNFSNTVTRIHEDPRVTRPYSENQWNKIVALGDKVDTEIEKHDLRLTMGGEPTFVSIDDMDGAEWNSLAHGEKKRELAGNIFLRLKDRFAKQGLIHYGQGKWYPGEPLPRWCLSTLWRKDGKPIWKDHELIADETKDYGYGNEQAQDFIAELTNQLDIDADYVVPGYEDTGYYLWKEGQLPAGVDPENSNIKDPLERKRLQDILNKGLDEVIGYALPIKYQEGKGENGHWVSSVWPFRAGKMLLIPGDSPMGYRMPLESLPWSIDDIEVTPERDPFADTGELPDSGKAKNTGKKQATTEIVHTALCVQVREGRLHVFMPPLSIIEPYLELVATLEATAEKLQLRIIIEGYLPPWDTRVQMLQVTPDPGVIEVNIHPASSWKELIDNTVLLYEEARQTRLGTEKFMLDGRHTGTGGGNHVTLGGPTPADSPFLRRPDLLRSLITYWQHHPALSYLFSGMFIGPTSQAPRIDEARDDNLYEIEIAMSELPTGESDKPWLVDRALRNFLIDLTGNTHRAEFCIDKLYSPDSATGRKGLLELRAFEMPPHERMSLLQILLIRALLAWFAREPYKKSMIRWGTELHDRFMLPYYIWADLTQVVRDLREAGFDFELEWFAPFKEFRFPHIGTINVAGMQLELHTALEPWHVLGEESTGQGTARYVDSSVERLQVSVHGLSDERYIVTCNGRKVPVRPTGVKGSYVGGVRYKAWDPYSALHPTIKAHTPLVFDIVDTANRHSIGGCTYHVSHPGGRSYDTFPVNANEAEARRSTRFLAHGHTQKEIEVSQESTSPDQLYSLDLRRPDSCN